MKQEDISITSYDHWKQNIISLLEQWSTIFWVSPSLANTTKLNDLPTREHATYNCLFEKHAVRKSKPQQTSFSLETYCHVIASANLIGNWTRLNSISVSVGIIGIRGNNIFSSELAIQNAGFDVFLNFFND